MSVIAREGIRWVADLTWQTRSSAWRTRRAVRQLGASMPIDIELQAGCSPHIHTEPLPLLVIELAKFISVDSWCTLAGGEGDRCAVFCCTDGQFPSNGDQTFASRDAAIATFDEALLDDWMKRARNDLYVQRRNVVILAALRCVQNEQGIRLSQDE